MKYQLYIVKEDHASVKSELGSRSIDLMRQQGHFGRRLTKQEVKQVKNRFLHNFDLRLIGLNGGRDTLTIPSNLIEGIPKYIFRFKSSAQLLKQSQKLSAKHRGCYWDKTFAECDRLGGMRVDITKKTYESISRRNPPAYGETATVLTEQGLMTFTTPVRMELIKRELNPNYITWWANVVAHNPFKRSKPAPIQYAFPGLEKTIPLTFNERVSYQD